MHCVRPYNSEKILGLHAEGQADLHMTSENTERNIKSLQ